MRLAIARFACDSEDCESPVPAFPTSFQAALGASATVDIRHVLCRTTWTREKVRPTYFLLPASQLSSIIRHGPEGVLHGLLHRCSR